MGDRCGRLESTSVDVHFEDAPLFEVLRLTLRRYRRYPDPVSGLRCPVSGVRADSEIVDAGNGRPAS